MSFCMPLMPELLVQRAKRALYSMSESGGRSDRRSSCDVRRHAIAIVMWCDHPGCLQQEGYLQCAITVFHNIASRQRSETS